MNVAVINLKDIMKYLVKILIAIFAIYLCMQYMTTTKQNFNQIISNNITSQFLTRCLEITIPELKTRENVEKHEIKITSLINVELGMLNLQNVKALEENTVTDIEEEETITEEKTISPQTTIPKVAETENVSDRNFVANSTNTYGTTKIDNQSSYTITEDMLVPDVEITDKKNVIIYHTHTCESYTPCETYNYTMTGNYRTTDSNYNVVRVGTELNTYLTQKGFNVIHDGTYHDYPAYSGSYARSLETVQRLLEGQSADIVIDLHRDAVGNGDTYGPTIMVNGQRVAQLMFVIGTDGGGLEHPNWIQNLKIAVKIQETANQMYPGLFRSIIIRNSRYNQHVAKAASIIEVGATANTLGECLLSMQCLANVLEEVCE